MSKIPKIIHQIYYQGEAAIPADYLRYRQTILDLHPDWEYYFWDEKKSRNFLQENYPEYLQLYDSYPYFIQRCDAIRYFLLHHYGGFYIDMDIEFIKPLDDLLENYELIFSKLVGFSNSIMGSIPQDPFWLQVFQELKVRKSSIPQKTNPLISKMAYYVCYSTGPLLLSNCILQEKYHEKNQVRICPGYIFEPDAPREINGRIIKSKDKTMSYSIHHMTKSWLSPYSKVLSVISQFLGNVYLSLGKITKSSIVSPVNLKAKKKLKQ